MSCSAIQPSAVEAFSCSSQAGRLGSTDNGQPTTDNPPPANHQHRPRLRLHVAQLRFERLCARCTELEMKSAKVPS
jgi:hypothetical protein